MEQDGTRGRVELDWKKKLLLVGLLAVATGVVVEVGARVIIAFKAGPNVLLYGTPLHQVQQEQGPAHTVMEHTNDAGAFKKYHPNEVKHDFNPRTGREFPVSINSHGFRGADFTLEKSPDTIRIVTLGASSTFGYHDEDDETYPFLLEQYLNETDRERRFEVINLGIPHLTSWQIRALFEAEALALDPDVVTFYEGINDAAEPNVEIREQKQAEEKSSLRERAASLSVLRAVYRSVRDRLLVVSLVDSLLQSKGVWTYTKADYEKHLTGKTERFLENVAAIEAACRARGIAFVAMKQQAKSRMIEEVRGVTYDEEADIVRARLDAGEGVPYAAMTFLTHKQLTDALGEWAASNGVPLVDAISILDQDRDVILSWVHLTPRGNDLIARPLSETIASLTR